MGQIRKLRWWQRLFNRDVRKVEADASSERLQVVDYTEGGLAVHMPVDLAHHWDELPVEVRRAFMADVDAQRRAGGQASGTHDWRP